MAEEKKKETTITIDGENYIYEDMSQEQQLLVNHIEDLNRKIASSEFNLDQLKIGREAFFGRLKTALETVEEVQQEEA
jgi:hypothetical protein